MSSIRYLSKKLYYVVYKILIEEAKVQSFKVLAIDGDEISWVAALPI